MARLLGKPPAMAVVIQKVVRRFAELFPGEWHEIPSAEVFAGVQIEANGSRRTAQGTRK
jgi:hypothetical protein